MRMLKVMAVAGLLSAMVGTAQAADGMERIQEFQAKFQAEQDRLWGDREQQLVKQETADKKADG
ncbi:hypothetical protein [Pseudomonas putida]|uniref:Uncharacterized protein n=1 Tax=Pseudomonas putida TaxID=303 RepID=A0A1Q9QZL7_PSEPU|nr:hypothetical protein [Pseudomonas putida]OLS60482.1 hypothetical protein PSEMO_48930 [Pseudomonas putida]